MTDAWVWIDTDPYATGLDPDQNKRAYEACSALVNGHYITAAASGDSVIIASHTVQGDDLIRRSRFEFPHSLPEVGGTMAMVRADDGLVGVEVQAAVPSSLVELIAVGVSSGGHLSVVDSVVVDGVVGLLCGANGVVGSASVTGTFSLWDLAAGTFTEVGSLGLAAGESLRGGDNHHGNHANFFFLREDESVDPDAYDWIEVDSGGSIVASSPVVAAYNGSISVDAPLAYDGGLVGLAYYTEGGASGEIRVVDTGVNDVTTTVGIEGSAVYRDRFDPMFGIVSASEFRDAYEDGSTDRQAEAKDPDDEVDLNLNLLSRTVSHSFTHLMVPTTQDSGETFQVSLLKYEEDYEENGGPRHRIWWPPLWHPGSDPWMAGWTRGHR